MSSIITSVYGHGTKFYIPNITEEECQKSFDKLAEVWESEFLTCLLGYELARDFLANVVFTIPSTDPDDPTLTVYATATSPYDVLLNGGEFTGCDGRLYLWEGFLGYEGSDGIRENSAIYNYIYYLWMQREAEVTGGGGVYTAENSQGLRTAPIQIMARAWQEMVEWNHVFHQFMLDQGRTDFPSYIGFRNGIGKCCDKRGNKLFENRSFAGF